MVDPSVIILVSLKSLVVFCALASVVYLLAASRALKERGRQQGTNEPESVSNERQQDSNAPENIFVSNQSSTVWNLNIVRLQYDIESFEVTTISPVHTREEPRASIDRKRLIRSKLHYQVVLPDMSNATIEILRGNSTKEDDATVTDAGTDDGDGNSTIALDHIKEESSASLFHRVQDLFSLRSLRPRKKDICSVCLEGFQPGQTICAAKNSCCNHMFHEECIRTWLMENYDCPLCRSNIMA